MLAMHSAILANYLLDPLAVPSAERESFIEQREWAFSQAMSGKLFAVANSEPGAGGDVHNSKATVDSGRALSGVKTFCSMGTNADYFMAAARAEEEGVEYFLVRKEENRVTCERPWDGVGMRSSESVTLRFQNAPTLGYLGYRGMLDGINNRHWSTLAFTAIFIGTAESLLEEIIDSSEAILQQASAIDLQLTLQACRAFLRHCVDTEPARADQAYRQLVRDCKLFVTRSLAREASALFIVQSGSAYRFSSGLSRKLRDLLAGPMLRPPIGMTFDTLWEELAEGRG